MRGGAIDGPESLETALNNWRKPASPRGNGNTCQFFGLIFSCNKVLMVDPSDMTVNKNPILVVLVDFEAIPIGCHHQYQKARFESPPHKDKITKPQGEPLPGIKYRVRYYNSIYRGRL